MLCKIRSWGWVVARLRLQKLDTQVQPVPLRSAVFSRREIVRPWCTSSIEFASLMNFSIAKVHDLLGALELIRLCIMSKNKNSYKP